ncbi:MAG: GNAT family N-acetyltransferase [Lewinellaceae bacterium]|nr:GNAT family N-acetyltransferase [Lewinellaceae bacterium]
MSVPSALKWVPRRSTTSQAAGEPPVRRAVPRRAIRDAEDVLSNGKGRLVLDTREVEIYDGANLAAFSFFDVGRQSMYSKQGIYDPAYQKYSLGFFTMLVEIGYALERGCEYYYPGYVVPGNQEFDYKHRVSTSWSISS